ncbi:MAG: hypothetical protein KDC54_00130 [Lewinella sp.]|nr:hypothetical protein [Lewinella sp.]
MQIQKFFSLAIIATFALSSAFLTSCEKEEATEPAISGEEAAELLEVSLKADSEGLAAEMMLAAELAQSAVNKNLTTLDCGETRDSTVSHSIANAWVTANYSSTFTWGLICNNFDIPTQLTFTRETAGDYESNRWISDDEASSNWIVSQLLTGDSWVVNGSYERLGYQESKVHEMRTFNSTITYQVTDLHISKDDRRISSGATSFSLAGENSDGNSFLITGGLVFNGDGTATLTINGESYLIEL